MHKKIITRFATVQWIELSIALIVLGGLTALNIYNEHELTASNEQARLITQANVVSKNIGFQIQGANDALLTVIHEFPGWKNSPELATQRLSSLANAMPAIRAISVFDAKGTLVFSNFSRHVGQNFSYRDYYITARKFADPNVIYVSPPFKGLSGNFVLNLTRVISGPNGEFAGIVSATLDPNYFKPLLASVLYTSDGRSSLIHSRGELFLIQPAISKLQGVNLAVPNSFFIKHMHSGKAETVFSGQLSWTKEYRMIAQSTLSLDALKLHDTLVVAVSRDLGLIFRSWRNTSIIQAICFIIFAAFSVSSLYIYQRRERKYAKIAADAERAVIQSERLFRSTYDSAAIGMALLEIGGRFTQANRALCKFVGYDESLLCEKTIQEITYLDDVNIDHFLMNELVISDRESYQVEKRFLHKNGSILWTLLTYSPLRDEQGNIAHFLLHIQNITEYKSLQERLQEQANYDFLTKLPNRRCFIERASLELIRVNRYGCSLSLLMIDIDHFKKINDNYGHLAGDIVLRRFSQLCKSQLRSLDIVGRYGGEEFALLLPETRQAEALMVAERLRQSVADAVVEIDRNQSIHFTVSIGLAVADSNDQSLETLLIKADAALYIAKQAGRNQTSVAPLQ